MGGGGGLYPVGLITFQTRCGYIMPSNPGQNLHLVSSQIHAVASSSHLANSLSQLVVLSSYLVESWSHLVVSSILITSPLLVYSSVILQLVVSPFNSSCRTSTRRSLYPYILARRLDTRSLVTSKAEWPQG